MIKCVECGRKWHQVCGLYLEEIWPEGFVCDGCVCKLGAERRKNLYTASNLPTNKLSKELEQRVNHLLSKKGANNCRVTIRVLASSEKKAEVLPLMRKHFSDKGIFPKSFPYRQKAIYAFQRIDGQDVCFFGLYVQEYGSDCPNPNKNRVYISYVDSVNYFRPKEHRTAVYHEILIGYLQHAKSQGFGSSHIWVCPPKKGSDYVFYKHPEEQKMPTSKRLQEWYEKMLQKAMMEGVVLSYRNIWDDAQSNNLNKVTMMPYFEGDHWTRRLEAIIEVCLTFVVPFLTISISAFVF